MGYILGVDRAQVTVFEQTDEVDSLAFWRVLTAELWNHRSIWSPGRYRIKGVRSVHRMARSTFGWLTVDYVTRTSPYLSRLDLSRPYHTLPNPTSPYTTLPWSTLPDHTPTQYFAAEGCMRIWNVSCICCITLYSDKDIHLFIKSYIYMIMQSLTSQYPSCCYVGFYSTGPYLSVTSESLSIAILSMDFPSSAGSVFHSVVWPTCLRQLSWSPTASRPVWTGAVLVECRYEERYHLPPRTIDCPRSKQY